MRVLKYLAGSISALIIIGCVKNEIADPVNDQTREYFPLIQGKFITYAVDSIVFDDGPGGNKKDTIQFQLKEEISGYQLTQFGDTIHYILRSRKDSSHLDWVLKDVWTSRYTISEALRTEENLTFRKLVFPLRDGRKWIGTSYIFPSTLIMVGTENIQAYQEWEAEVQAFDIADDIGTFHFDEGNVMHVLQSDFDDETSIKRYVFEKYVRGIGLVARTDTLLDSRCKDLPDFSQCLGKPWTEHADKGYILSQVMIDHN